MRPSIVSLAAILAFPTFANAQAFIGRVTDSSKAPIRDVALTLIDTGRRIVALSRSDQEGRFRLRAPDPGVYGITVRRIGYRPHATAWMELEPGETFEIDFMLAQLPPELTAVIVSAQRDSIMKSPVLGLNLKASSATVVTPMQVELRAITSRDFFDLVRDLAPTWARVSGQGAETCVSAPASNPPDSCLMVLVDGVRINPPNDVSNYALPEWVDYIVFLRASDAGVFFGTGANAGVMLVATKKGGRVGKE